MTLEDKDLCKQYHRIARLEAEKFLPDKEGGYTWQVLQAKDLENVALCLKENQTHGMTWTDRNTLKPARNSRMREIARQLLPKRFPVHKPLPVQREPARCLTFEQRKDLEEQQRRECIHFTWMFVFCIAGFISLGIWF